MRIRNKLFLALASAGICLVLLMLVLMRWSIDRGMLEYVNTREAEMLAPLVASLSEAYGQTGSWRALKDEPKRVKLLLRSFDPRPEKQPSSRAHREHERDERRPTHAPKFRRLIVLDANESPVFGRVDKQHFPVYKYFSMRPIIYDGETVGWLASPKRLEISEGFELSFIQQQVNAFMLISGFVLILALAIAWPLARHFIVPIQDITRSVSGLAKGRYQRLSVKRSDELGSLARDINELSKTLEQNETSRKRWFADTSHELRTPIAILKGELEAMIDGVRPLNKEGLESLQQEVLQLQKLVDDLYELANTDIGSLQYRKGRHDLVSILTQQVEQHRGHFDAAHLRLDFNPEYETLWAWVDDTRIVQLMHNLFANSLKYTSTGGRVLVELQRLDASVMIRVSDTAPAVPDEALVHLFEHLYRVESSRNRRTGGSGLGLAICKRIVDAHHGVIHATHSDMGGLSIEVRLPLTSPLLSQTNN